MRVLITGVTGLIGRRLAVRLARAGHEVVGTSRQPARALQDVPALASAFAWKEDGPDYAALDDVEAVVHLAGEPVAGRWSEDRRIAIRATRDEGTRALVEAMLGRPEGARPRVLVSTSAIGFYGDRGEDELDETSAPGEGFLPEVCCAWEARALAAGDEGVRVVPIRLGLVLTPDGGALAEMLPLARKGVSGPLGSGRQWWSWIHVDDAIELIVFAIEQDALSGVVAGTSPGPVRQRDFARTLGRVLGRPAFLPAPTFAIRLALGGFSAEVLTSRKVLPVAARRAGFTFRFAELEPALRDLLTG